MNTETTLLQQFGAPVVRLEDVCQQYMDLPIKRANERAALNMLGIPTFRLSASRKAPRMIKLTDLAEHIDTTAAEARKQWETSQV